MNNGSSDPEANTESKSPSNLIRYSGNEVNRCACPDFIIKICNSFALDNRKPYNKKRSE